jgi:metallo-beta-lactamase family protein
MDSAHIQEKDAEFFNKKIADNPSQHITPIYTFTDVAKCVEQFITINYARPYRLLDGVTLTFLDAGHVLGSSIVVLDIEEEGKEPKRLVFSGDLGRKRMPILRDPAHVENVDYMILESTYGNRKHDPIDVADDELAQAVADIVKRKGKMLIPAFALERTQEILYCFHKLRKENRIPRIPIYIDSPLAIKITDIFRLHPECYDEEMQALFDVREDPFESPDLEMVRSKEGSQALNDEEGPMIIMAGSGMCEGGRILHHLRNNIANEKTMILIVGFQAKNTLGRKIVERQSTVRIFGMSHDLEAEVRIINAYSGHADMDDLDRFALHSKDTLKQLFLVHGELEQSQAMAERLRTKGIDNILVPERGQYVDV